MAASSPLLLLLLGAHAPVAAGAAASWQSLAARLPSASAPEPRVIDPARTPGAGPPKPGGGAELILFRERNGWCPYSERVWLALEMKNVPYTTVLIDNTGRKPAWFGGTTPRVRWADGSEQGESLDLLREIDARFPEGPALWPAGAPAGEVDRLIAAFRDTFPRATRPSSRAAFLFRGSGPVPLPDFVAALDGVDALLGRTAGGGPFFLGAQPSAADVAWAPFLERYAYQLPCLHAGLRPRDPARWPHLALWYAAMEEGAQLRGAYGARVQGNARSWRKVLAMAGFGNAGEAPELLPEGQTSPAPTPPPAAPLSAGAALAWAEYAGARAHVAAHPAAEAAARLLRNREAVGADAVEKGALAQPALDEALRLAVQLLLELAPPAGAGASDDEGGAARLEQACARLGAADAAAASSVAALAAHLEGRLCVPRDMGVHPARAISALADATARAAG